MATKHRYVNTHFWDDSFVVNLDPIEKLLFLYFLTNPLANIAGAYEISLRRVAFDTGIDKDMILKILARFEAADKMIFKDGWILITNFIKNQAINPNIQKGIAEAVSHCPDWIKERLCIGVESLSKASEYLNLNLNSNSKSEAKPEPAKTEASGSAAAETASAETPKKPERPNDPPSPQIRDLKHISPPSAAPPSDAHELFYAEALKIYNANSLSNAPRWNQAITQIIENGYSLERFSDILKELIADKTRKFPVTPENVVSALEFSKAQGEVKPKPSKFYH